MATITKIADNRFGGKHPNRINVGYKKSGRLFVPRIGCNYFFGSLITAKVTAIYSTTHEGFKFDTENSTYQVNF